MGTSQPSRSRGKRAAKAQGATLAFKVSIAAREDASPFTEPARAGEALPNARGRLLAECWRGLGEGRPYLETDACALGPRSLQGILRLKAGVPQALDLPAAIRLFKVMSAQSLANLSGAPARGAAGLWKKGYVETPLATLKQVVEARAALKAAGAKAKPSR